MVLVGVMSGVVYAVVEYIFAILIQNFLYYIGLISGENLSLGLFSIDSFEWLIVALLTLGIFRSISTYFRIYLPRVAFQKYNQEVREKIIAASLNELEGTSVHSTIATFSDEVTRAGNSVFCLVRIFTTFFSVSVLGIIAFVTAPLEMGVGLLCVAIAFLFLKLLKRDKGNMNLSTEWDKVNKRLSDGLRNSYFLHVYNLVSDEIKSSRTILESYFQFYRKFIERVSLEAAVPGVLSIVIIVVITLASKEMGTQKPAVLLTFFYVFLRFVQAASELVVAITDFNFNFSGVEQITKWFDQKKKRSENQRKRDTVENISGIDENFVLDVKNLSFAHEGSEELFKDLNFNLGRGECLVISGKSGSGKSTLVSLLLGLLNPSKGSIEIGDIDVRSLGSFIADIVGYVGPTPYLIEGSLRENLLYPPRSSSETVSDDEIYKVLDRLGLEERVKEIGIDSIVTEKLDVLSTGQRQRLTIARAILKKPKLLILDESTSNLDIETEEKVIQAIQEVSSDSIVVVVTHREAMLKLANKTIHL